MAFLAIAILLLLLVPVAISIGVANLDLSGGRMSTLSLSPNYTESVSLYLTSAETFWQAQFSGGNITLASLNVPSSVTSFSITLTHYQKWNSQYELFTKYGFGLLGSYEPLPDGAFLVINGSSQTDAANLANSLNQMFGVNFVPYSSSSSSFAFMTPLSFQTEVHVYFWKLVPTYYQGFAGQFTEQQLESNDLAFYRLSYSAGTYSIAIGGLKPLVSTNFLLYNQLGVSKSFNYSSFASSSTVQVKVLGGLITKTNSTYVNNYNNYTAYMSTNSTRGTNTVVPNLNGTLDFSFPTIVAYRQIQTLNPATNQNYSASIVVMNVSPSGTPVANDVTVNDTWLNTYSSNFSVTQGKPSGNQNLTSGQSMTVAYEFKVLHGSTGPFNIGQIPVNYNFLVGNKTINSQIFLNTETLSINGTGPAIEAIETPSTATVQSGQSLSVNVTITNKGNSVALNLAAANQTKANLGAGSTWSFISTFESSALTTINSTVLYTVSWLGGTAQTNSMNAPSSFASPSSPASSIFKSVDFFKSSNSANVTLTILDNSATSISNLTISDSIPLGTVFARSYEPKSLGFSGGLISGNISTLAANSNMTFTYSLNITQLAENYVFMPANVSSSWNNEVLAHFSQGFGLPLGVSTTKQISPADGFQGSAVSMQIGVSNQGTLPIYDVSLNPTGDTFLTLLGGGGASKNILPTGSQLNSTLDANLTGTPGSYNSSSSTASFIFAGYNQTATSNTFKVTIFQDLQGTMSVVSGKVEELHNIVIMIEITNPSNLTVSNVAYSTSLPNNLNLVSGQLSFGNASLAPNATFKNNITIYTNLPEQYNLNGGTLKFEYNGQKLNGQTSGLSLSVADDLTIRYGIPGLIGIVIVLATLLYVRRLTRQTKT